MTADSSAESTDEFLARIERQRRNELLELRGILDALDEDRDREVTNFRPLSERLEENRD